MTGGSRGIGAAIAVHFANKGISALAVTYSSNVVAAEDVLSTCRSIGVNRTLAVKADLLDPQIGPNLIAKVLEVLEADRIDIVVNNAAITDPQLLEPFPNTTINTFTRMMQGNVYAPLSVMNAVMPHLPAKGGRIINISSAAGQEASTDPYMTYGASKAALDIMTRSIAVASASETGATFNTVCVGPTVTEGSKAALQEMGPIVEEDSISRATAEKRMGEPEDIAFIVGFLATEEGRWINGACIPAHGGRESLLGFQR